MHYVTGKSGSQREEVGGNTNAKVFEVKNVLRRRDVSEIQYDECTTNSRMLQTWEFWHRTSSDVFLAM